MAKAVFFPYERILTPIGFVWIPLARVEISRQSIRMELDMIVDTGADLTMIPYQVGVNLGLRRGRSRITTLSGISGGTPYVLKRVSFRIGPFRVSARTAWAQRDDVPMLLGRVDMLDRFKVIFDGRRRRVTIRR